MKKNVCYFIACLIVPGIWLWGAPSAAAQGHYLKNASNQAAHKAKGVLSPAQKAVKQSQLEALQQVRRELARTPGILFTQDFKPQLAHIAKKYFHKRLLNKKGKASVIFGTPIDGDFEYIYDYDIYSNIHYGYAGRLSNLTWFELELGSRKHDSNKGHSFLI